MSDNDSTEVIDPTLEVFATGDTVVDRNGDTWTVSAPPEFPVTQWLRDGSEPNEIVPSDLLQAAYAPISRALAEQPAGSSV